MTTTKVIRYRTKPEQADENERDSQGDTSRRQFTNGFRS